MTCDEGFEDGISRSLRLKEGCHRVQRRACMFVMSSSSLTPLSFVLDIHVAQVTREDSG